MRPCVTPSSKSSHAFTTQGSAPALRVLHSSDGCTSLRVGLNRQHDLGLGKLYRRTGQREQAREHLTTATTMYREMDMRFWLEQAEAEMKELS